MDTNIILLPQTPSVYLVSGKLCESDRIAVLPDSVVYLTVLPLDAGAFPYTVKLIGTEVASNQSLAFMCKLGEGEYALRLGKRLFVYSSEHCTLPSDPCLRFFYCVKGKHFASAAQLLGQLGRELGERELSAFFNDYSEMIKVGEKYYAADSAGVGHECTFELRGGKIENISIE